MSQEHGNDTSGADTGVTDTSSNQSDSTASIVASPQTAGKVSVGGEDSSIVTKSGESQEVSFPQNWKDMLGDLGQDPGLLPVNDIPSLAKSFINLQKQLGKEKVPLPSENASEQEIIDFYRKAGRLPDKMEEYKIDMPEGAEFSDGFFTQMKKAGFEAGINPLQMQKIMKTYADLNNQALQQHKESIENAIKENTESLRKEWGEAFEQKMSRIQNAVNEYAHGTNEEQVFSFLEQEFNGKRLAENPDLIRLLDYLISNNYEDELLEGKKSPMNTNNELDEKIRQMSNSIQGNPLYDRNHPDHFSAVQERNRLFERRYPNKNKDMF